MAARPVPVGPGSPLSAHPLRRRPRRRQADHHPVRHEHCNRSGRAGTASVGSDFPHEQASGMRAGSAPPPPRDEKNRSAGVRNSRHRRCDHRRRDRAGARRPGRRTCRVLTLIGATAAAGWPRSCSACSASFDPVEMLSLLLAFSLVSTWEATTVPFISTDNGTQHWTPTARPSSTYSWNAGNAASTCANWTGRRPRRSGPR